MHRAYQPITPANNKLLKKRWDMSRYDTHRRKVCFLSARFTRHGAPIETSVRRQNASACLTPIRFYPLFTGDVSESSY